MHEVHLHIFHAVEPLQPFSTDRVQNEHIVPLAFTSISLFVIVRSPFRTSFRPVRLYTTAYSRVEGQGDQECGRRGDADGWH